MRILWVTNQPTPNIARDLNIVTGNGGGWMIHLSQKLSDQNNTVISMAFPIENNIELLKKSVDGIVCYGIPIEKSATQANVSSINMYIKMIKEFKPDIIHIWGTEYLHSYYAIVAAEECSLLDHTVVSIQGLVSVYAKHYYGFIEDKHVKKSTLKDIYRRNSLIQQRNDFIKRGKYEVKTLTAARHVIGRTDWDLACTRMINPSVNYHFCNETLRNSFYNQEWKVNNCEKFSIFVSQSQYPIKGLHILLEAMPTIIKKYPNAHIYATGRNRMASGLKERLRDSSYDKYLRKLIKDYKLEHHITFLGPLTEEMMCDRFCKSHVFVSPSSIENSPNSVGEAMLLGVPVVSSDVGGVKNMLTHNVEGFVYQADAPYMLAYYISKIFDDDTLAVRLSVSAREHAQRTHDPVQNQEQIMKIYNGLLSC